MAGRTLENESSPGHSQYEEWRMVLEKLTFSRHTVFVDSTGGLADVYRILILICTYIYVFLFRYLPMYIAYLLYSGSG